VSLLLTGMGMGQVVGANEVIPVPAPTSDRSRWTDGPGRFRVETEVNGVKLRGWDYKAEPTAVAQAEMMRGGRGGGRRGGEPSKSGEGPFSPTAATGAPADKSVPIVVFFNGNLMTLDRSDELYRRLAGLGLEVVAYDYRGYGFSEGQPDVGSFRTDALAIFDKVQREYAGRPCWCTDFRWERRWPRMSPRSERYTGWCWRRPLPRQRRSCRSLRDG